MANVRYGAALYYRDVADCAHLAQLAEETGWDGFFVGDAIWCVDPLIALTAAAGVTEKIRLGTMVLAMPLRVPRHVASEVAALDNYSHGRMILGMATGATWMGWQAFPDEPRDIRTRVDMLDESIDVITLLFLGQPFDYDGKHYHLKLTDLDVQHYPPRPCQQPRVPMWVAGAWPRMKSMERTLKCDGILPLKMNEKNEFETVLPEDVRAIRQYVAANRSTDTPFDIVVEGQTGSMPAEQARATIQPYAEAGITWWIEGLWQATPEQIEARLRQGPPRI